MRRPLLTLATLISLVAPCLAQGNSYADEKAAATRLLDANRVEEAEPQFEKLAREHPGDGELQAKLGFSLFSLALKAKEPELRASLMARGRQALTRAKQLGFDHPLIDQMLSAKDFTPTQFSESPEVNAMMQQAEAAFGDGKFERAAQLYIQAFQREPRLYDAALYAGDANFRAGHLPAAREWLTKAIAVNPKRETAYRYLADVQLKAGELHEARANAVSAVVAEPYTALAWGGLRNYASIRRIQARHPQLLGLDNTVVEETGPSNMTIHISPNAGSQELVLTYAMARSLWRTAKFASTYPGQTYRHTLSEEADALNTTAQVARELRASGKASSLAPWVDQLLELQAKGLIEAYVLLGRPDREIARDYARYRETHRPMLQRYLEEVYLNGDGPGQK